MTIKNIDLDMTNLHKRMLPDTVGIEPATSAADHQSDTYPTEHQGQLTSNDKNFNDNHWSKAIT